MKIAIVRLSSLGDIILGMASLQFIRRHLPDCRITWIADSRFADILDHQKDIGQIIKIELKGMKKEKSLSSLFMEYHQLRSAGPFDAVIDLHGMIKSAVTAKILGKNTCGFDKGVIKEPLGCLFYRHTYEVPLDMPAACRYASLAMQSLGLPFREPDMSVIQPFLFARDDDFLIAKEYFSSERRNIIIVPETSAANKNYPYDKFAMLANQLGENILICHGNQREFETAVRIAELSPYVRILPRLNLNQLKAVISRCDLLIGGDSGPTHIAWACGAPSITLFGATPVCIYPTKVNKAIKTPTNLNLRKPDPTDFSIHEIAVQKIFELSKVLSANTKRTIS